MTEVQRTDLAAAPHQGFDRSRELHARASQSLAGGVSTAFRMFERPVPLFIKEARGAELVDVDGNRYVDFVAGFGPIVLGHADPVVSEAAVDAVSGPQQIGAQHEGEIALAEALCEHVPAFERVRLSLSGSEAVHAALRLARAATGRQLVLKFAGHYHGWLDGVFTATSHVAPGYPESRGQSVSALAGIRVIEWNDEQALREAFATAGSQLAAVIMEAIPCNQGFLYPRDGYLELARQLCDDAGTVLIFDEVITGFRLGLGGAQALTAVTPDLAVVAKAMANGYPISAFGGRADLMELVASNRVVHAGTYNGGGVSVAAALATIERLADPTFEAHERMRRLGRRLMYGLQDVAARHDHHLVAQGAGPVFFAWLTDRDEVTSYREHLQADSAAYARWAELMLGEGVRVIPAGRWYLTAAHTEAHIDEALDAADRAFARL
ncbi:MAG: glutamate-semialdehyde -aminomutase [Solirubrobacteraceae bacterium]